MKYDIALVVGRFQPFHLSHEALVEHALSLADKVLILLGSAKSSPDIKNPFTPIMRERMIRSCFSSEDNERIKCIPLRDYPYNENIWISEVQNAVRNEQEDNLYLPEEEDALHNIKLGEQKVCLVGHLKDESSYYLKSFPQWTFEEFNGLSKTSKKINATDIRASYLEMDSQWEDCVTDTVRSILKDFIRTDTYKNLVKEYAYTKKYKQDSRFIGLPFEPTFVTTDAGVVSKGHILVVRRGTNPGKRKLALPGGFLATDHTLIKNCIKELKEETRIHVPSAVLKRSIKDSGVFDF